MNKIHIAALAYAVLMGGAITAAHAEDGTITFTGVISDTACTISADSKDITVDFGTVASGYSDFEPQMPKKTFNINLEKCPAAASSATVSWNGVIANPPAGIDSTSLSLYQDGTSLTNGAMFWNIAEGNQVEDGASVMTDLVSFDGTPGAVQPISEGNNSLTYTAALMLSAPTSGAFIAGEMTGEATYSITYN